MCIKYFCSPFNIHVLINRLKTTSLCNEYLLYEGYILSDKNHYLVEKGIFLYYLMTLFQNKTKQVELYGYKNIAVNCVMSSLLLQISGLPPLEKLFQI